MDGAPSVRDRFDEPVSSKIVQGGARQLLEAFRVGLAGDLA